MIRDPLAGGGAGLSPSTEHQPDNGVMGLLAAQSSLCLGLIHGKKSYMGAATGAVIYAIALVLNYVPKMEGPGIVLFFVGSLVVGAVCRSIKWGFATSFVLPLLFQLALTLVVSSGAFSDLNVIMAVLLMLIINSAIHGVLGAIGGLVGQRILK